MTITGTDIKTGLCTTAQVHYLTKLMEGNPQHKRKPLPRSKAYLMLTLIMVAERSSGLCILDNFETLYKRVFIYAKNN